MASLKELRREAEEVMGFKPRPPPPCGDGEEPGSPEHKQGTVTTAEMPRVVHEGQDEGSGPAGRGVPPLGFLEHTYRACLDIGVGSSGLGQGHQPCWEKAKR